MSGFSLRALIDAEVEKQDTADPAVIADRVAAAVPSRFLRAALRQTLGGFVTNAVNLRRNAALSRTAPQSRRWESASVAYQGLLGERLFTPDGWKFLGDCTRDDLIAASEERERRAVELTNAAGFYKRLAALLDEHGAATVADLPAEHVEAAA